MMKDSSNQSLPSDAPAGKKFRLVVSSAEEAVRVIREKLGDDAKVLSVKQFGGEGLKLKGHFFFVGFFEFFHFLLL